MAIDGQYKTPNPTIRVCHWFRNGQTNGSPYLAFVFKEDACERGVLSLSVLATPRLLESYDGVLHAGDPRLKQFPDRALREGCWDYLPSEKVPKLETKSEKIETKPAQKPLPPKT